MEIIWAFWALLGTIIGVIVGYLASDDITDNKTCDKKSFCGNSCDIDVSDNANNIRICDVQYLERLQEEVMFMLSLSSPHEKEVIYQVSDVLEFMIEVVKEVDRGISEEENN